MKKGIIRVFRVTVVSTAALVVCGFSNLRESRNEPPSLFLDPAPGAAALALSADSNESRSRVVRINPVLLEPGLGSLQEVGSRVTANFFAGDEQTVVIDSVEIRGPGEFSCIGHIENVPDSSVVLAAASGAVVGTFSSPWRSPLHVHYAGSGLHRVGQVTPPSGAWCRVEDFSAVPNFENPPQPGPGEETNEVPVIDFLVLYTARALSGAGGEEGINALMDFAVAENNYAYANSGIKARWNIAGRALVSYTDSGNLQTDWNWARSDSTVATLRNFYAADLVMLIVEYDRYGGAGIAGGTHTVFIRPVIDAGAYTVTHEVGHLLGAGHDRFTCQNRANWAGCGAAYPYSYGQRFQADGMTYHTIMAYEPGAPIPYYSNPEVLFRGVPTGSSFATNAADNARTITERAPAVAGLLSATCRFAFEAPVVAVSEAAPAVSLNVLRSGDISRAGTVEILTLVGTARPPLDYTHTVAQLLFASNQASQTVSIPLVQDALGEGNESFSVMLRNPSSGMALAFPQTTRVLILDDDLWLGFAATNVVVPEAASSVEVVVRRGGDTNSSVQISYTTEGITATAGEDFVSASGTLAFVTGETEKPVTITLLPDSLAERDEQFGLRLLNPSAGQIPGPALATVRIIDDERPGSVAPSFQVLAGSGSGSKYSVAVTYSDGRFLCARIFNKADGSTGIAIYRYLPDATPDAQFTPLELLMTATPEPGLSTPGVFPGRPPVYLSLDGDEKILVGAWAASVKGTLRTNLFRLNRDGSLDSSFQASVDCMAVPCSQPDSKILIAGNFHTVNGVSRPYFARLNLDGSLDPTFNPKPNNDSLGGSVCVPQANGQVLVSGLFFGFEGQPREYFARLNADGSLDRLFRARPNGMLGQIQMLPDQRILIAGGFTSPWNGLALLKPDGSTDYSFIPTGLGLNGPVWWAHRLPDGRVLAAGTFTAVGSTRQNYLIRLNPDGSLDTTFDTGSGPNDSVGFAVEPSGSILVFGPFTSLNGLPGTSLIRLNSDGTRPTFGPTSTLVGGDLRLKLFGNAGHSYDIEKSVDLSHWEKLRTETFTHTEFEWTQPNDRGGALFFRAREAAGP